MNTNHISEFEYSALYFSHSLSLRSRVIYNMTLLFIAIALCSLRFLYVDISVTARGMVRPSAERTEIKSAVSGIIDTLFYHEGQYVREDEIILRLRDRHSDRALLMNRYEQEQKAYCIHDLELLTAKSQELCADSMLSPVYRVQARTFHYKIKEQRLMLQKIEEEVKIDSELSVDRIISQKEMTDKISENERQHASFKAFQNERFSTWENELLTSRLDLNRLKTEQQEILEERKKYEIKATVSGTIQDINPKYQGGTVQEGEPICIISPETSLVAECYIPSASIGMLKRHQRAVFQVDAFNYNYFGTVGGLIQRIDNDFSIIDNSPVYKVRCLFCSTTLHSRNGYTVRLKKGMNLQVHFIVAKRNLWQLLFDKMDSWFNPVTPQ